VTHARHNQATEPSHSAGSQAGSHASAKRAPERLQAAKKEAERTAAAANEAKKKEAKRTAAAANEVKKKEAERTEAARKEARRKESERTAAAANEAKRKEAERVEAARKEDRRKESERMESVRQEAERQASASNPLAYSRHRFDVCCVDAPQRAIALLTQLSELAPSAIIDVLGNADDRMRRTANTLSERRTLHASALVRTACPCRASATYGSSSAKPLCV
jgi:hypothetical protein